MRIELALLLMFLLTSCVFRSGNLEERLESCQKRIEVLEQRQKLVEEMLDEALSKWNTVEEAVNRLEKFRARMVDFNRRSELMEAYSEAYLSWYRGNYREAVRKLSSFVARYNDKYLVQQAKLLLADSYWRIGKKSSACQVLDSFVKKYRDSLFYCSAYYKAKVIGCRNVEVDGRCSGKR